MTTFTPFTPTTTGVTFFPAATAARRRADMEARLAAFFATRAAAAAAPMTERIAA